MLGLTKTSSRNYAVLPLRDIVVFPHMIVPLFVGREKSVRALEHVMHESKKILLLTQKAPSEDDPGPEQLYNVGTVGTILQLLKLPDGTVKVLVEGGPRVKVTKFIADETYLEAETTEITEEADANEEMDALARAVTAQFEQYVKLNKKIPPEVIVSINQIEGAAKMADTIASHLALKIEQKQELLEILTTTERLEKIYGLMEGEIGVLQVEKRIRNRVKRQMEKTQREYYLNEQMKAIQKELGESEDGLDELGELEKRIDEARLPKVAGERARHEMKKLRQMSPMSAEATVVRNYLDWIVNLPWSKSSRVKKDIRLAQKILDKDHYGLDKVKERILEYLAVQQRTKKVKGPILCLVGPPGVGKTSLGQSVARATNRNFVRMSLGGVRDESEIRGHRRTYIGAMPGKVLQGMKKAKTVNPLFLLDEIDKLGSDWRGDPSSALLEVLDPEQNSTFQDHYLELDYDLSDVMFVCTANSLQTMPRPLLDRMEIIRISGYTEDEKLEIVKRHLLSKQLKAAGLRSGEFSISDAALRDLIRFYTREAGVRSLEREVANLCRKAIKEILMKGRKKIAITPRSLERYAGVRKFSAREIDEHDNIGVVNGLSYSDYGGSILAIEAVDLEGKDGKVSMTGNLKDVMKESITVAEMLIKSRAAQYGIDYESLKTRQIHVHVPEGAVPKDGPSAGAAMVTSIISCLTDIPVRKDIAMTGEVNLRGKVTEIGGLKEKLLGALRGGIKTVLIPIDNVKDLEDIPANVKKELEIISVKTIDEVLAHALLEMPVPISVDLGAKIEKIPSKSAENKGEDVIHH
ncbi:MAG: endopeptidase La [Alphaproteobacteria bacterium]|nr:endopeptidase La [Alphaproteobacteria bacterium]